MKNLIILLVLIVTFSSCTDDLKYDVERKTETVYYKLTVDDNKIINYNIDVIVTYEIDTLRNVNFDLSSTTKTYYIDGEQYLENTSYRMLK